MSMSINPAGVWVDGTMWPLFDEDGGMLCLDPHDDDLGPHYHRIYELAEGSG